MQNLTKIEKLYFFSRKPSSLNLCLCTQKTCPNQPKHFLLLYVMFLLKIQKSFETNEFFQRSFFSNINSGHLECNFDNRAKKKFRQGQFFWVEVWECFTTKESSSKKTTDQQSFCLDMEKAVLTTQLTVFPIKWRTSSLSSQKKSRQRVFSTKSSSKRYSWHVVCIFD